MNTKKYQTQQINYLSERDCVCERACVCVYHCICELVEAIRGRMGVIVDIGLYIILNTV